MLSDELAKRLAQVDLSDPEQVNQFMRFLSTKNATTADKLFEAYLSARLSGTALPARKLTSDLIMAAMEPVRLTASATVDAVRAAITGTPRERFFGEAPRFIAGALGGTHDAFRNFLYTMRTEMPTTAAAAFERPGRGAAIGGTLGRVVRAPLTLIQGINEFSAAFDKRGGLYSNAYRMAASEGLSGEQLATRVANLIHEPPTELIEAAHKEELRLTFQQQLGAAGQAAMRFREANPVLKWLFPIVRTPTNIAKTAGSYTPVNAIRAYLKGISGGALSDELGTAALGTIVGAGIGTYVAGERLTGGGPADKGQNQIWRQTHEPYSFKVGDRWYSYEHLQPVAPIIGMAADLSENFRNMSEEEWDRRVNQFAHSVSRNMIDRTWLGQLKDLVTSIDEPAGAGKQVVNSLAGSVVPNVVSSVAKGFDETRRDVQTPLDAIKGNIPGLREELPVKRDYRGRPEPSPGSGPINRMFSPVQATPGRGDRIDALLSELKASAGSEPRAVQFGGHAIKLTPQEYDRMQEISGGFVDRMLSRSADYLSRQPEAIQRAVIDRLIRQGRAAGHAVIVNELRKSPGFAQRMLEGRVRAGAIPIDVMEARP